MPRAVLAIFLFGVVLPACGGRGRDGRQPASPVQLDRREIEEATGTASPYFDPRDERQPVRGIELDAPRPRVDTQPGDGDTTPDAGPAAVSRPLEDAGNPLPDADTHRG